MFSAVGWIGVEEAESGDEFGDPTFEPRQPTLEAITTVIDDLVGPPLPHLSGHHSRRGWLAALSRRASASRPNAPRRGPEALFRVDNGTWTVLIDTHRNHRQEWPGQLFRQVGQIAAGSFGFMHVWDDEHPRQSEQFMRWTMVLGRLDVQDDPRLRPVMARWMADAEP